MQTWFRRLAAAMLLTVLPVYAAAGYYAWRLPDSYYVRNGSALALSTALHITAESEPEQVKAAFSSTAATEEQYTLSLFGINCTWMVSWSWDLETSPVPMALAVPQKMPAFKKAI